MKIQKTVAVGLSVLLNAGLLAAQERPLIEHRPLDCIPASCGRARVTARVTPDSSRSVRVYFRAAEQAGDYYIEMMKGKGGDYWAILPATADGTSSVVYRITTRDGQGTESSTAPITTPVSAACAGARLSPEEVAYASNITLGLTSDTQAKAPAGFKCAGIQSQISVTGELLGPNETCRQILLTTASENCDPKGGPLLVSGASVPPVAAAGLVVAGAALATGGAVIYKNNRGSGKPVSSLRP